MLRYIRYPVYKSQACSKKLKFPRLKANKSDYRVELIQILTLWAGGVLEVVLVLDVGHAQVGLHLESEGRPVGDQLGPRVVVEHHGVLVQLVPFLSVGSLDAHLEAFWGYF